MSVRRLLYRTGVPFSNLLKAGMQHFARWLAQVQGSGPRFFMKRVLITAFCFFTGYVLKAQSCTTPGQTPSTAFPVCGIRTFNQTNVPICSSHSLFVPGCTGTGTAAYQDKNPFWYKFTCYQAGTLSFLISPNNSGDDYDWQLYDITGRNPDDVFTDPSLVITG